MSGGTFQTLRDTSPLFVPTACLIRAPKAGRTRDFPISTPAPRGACETHKYCHKETPPKDGATPSQTHVPESRILRRTLGHLVTLWVAVAPTLHPVALLGVQGLAPGQWSGQCRNNDGLDQETPAPGSDRVTLRQQGTCQLRRAHSRVTGGTRQQMTETERPCEDRAVSCSHRKAQGWTAGAPGCGRVTV